MNENSTLRKMALAAKRRLNGVSNEKQKRTKTQVSSFAVYRNLYKNEFCITTIDNTDEALYEKVKTLLDVNFDSPIILKELVDNEVFAKLSENQKMAYMLKLADKYCDLRKRYIKENRLDLVV